MKLILDTDTCRIFFTGAEHILLIRMGNVWIKNAPFPGDLRGQIAAVTLSLDVMAGKVWPHEIVDKDGKPVPVTSDKPKQLRGAR